MKPWLWECYSATIRFLRYLWRRIMRPSKLQVRGSGFITPELIAQFRSREGINGTLVDVVAKTIAFASALPARVPVTQKTPEEKQRVTAAVILLRLTEIVECTFILAANGVRQ